MCAHGAVICYGVLLEGSDLVDKDETDDAQEDSDVMPGSLDTTAMAGADYVRHYRECIAHGHKAPYATKYAGVMLGLYPWGLRADPSSISSSTEFPAAKSCARSESPDTRDCRFVREHAIAFDEFDIGKCTECDEGAAVIFNRTYERGSSAETVMRRRT